MIQDPLGEGGKKKSPERRGAEPGGGGTEENTLEIGKGGSEKLRRKLEGTKEALPSRTTTKAKGRRKGVQVIFIEAGNS